MRNVIVTAVASILVTMALVMHFDWIPQAVAQSIVRGSASISGAVSISGTPTVLPGNTANTTPWLFKPHDGSAALFTAAAAAADNEANPTVGGIKVYNMVWDGSTWDRATSGVLDPCQGNAKVYTTISQATSTQLITGTASKKIYICSISLVAGAAEAVSLVAGTGSVCATNTVAVIGATTAANGMSFAANGGIVIGTGHSSIAATTVNQDNLCLFQDGTDRVSGVMTSVVQ